MNRPFALFAVLAGLAIPFLLGCGTATSMSGSITYEGQPVENGTITLIPADGKGPTAGAPIAKGQYRVEKLTPGKKIVQIRSTKTPSGPISSDDMRRAAEEAAKQGKAAVSENLDEIPANAVGNNTEIEAQQGAQTRDFALTKPRISSTR